MDTVLTILLKAALLSHIQLSAGGDLTQAVVKGSGLIEREGVTKKISEIEIKPTGKNSLEIRVRTNRSESFKANYKKIADSSFRLELH